MKYIQELKLGYIFLLALVFRLIGAYYFGNSAFPDSVEYYEAGSRLFEYGSFYNQKIMPIYPIVSYLSISFFSFQLIDILLSSCSIFLIYYLGKSLLNEEMHAKVASLGIAVYPFSIFYASSGLTETSFVFCVLLAFMALYQKKIYLGLLFLILSVLIRPTLDLINPLIILCFCIVVYKESVAFALKQLLKYALVYIFLLAPWWIYNYNEYGQFVRLNLGAGEILYGGNNPNNKDGRASDEGLDFSEFRYITDLVERDKTLKAEAYKYILDNKAEFILKSFRRLAAFWNIFPNHQKHRSSITMIVSAMSMLMLYMGVLGFLFIADKSMLKRCVPIFIMFIYLSAIHAVTIGSIRYRYPLEPFMILFLSIALTHYYKQSLSVRNE